jgi:hypothetical protein
LTTRTRMKRMTRVDDRKITTTKKRTMVVIERATAEREVAVEQLQPTRKRIKWNDDAGLIDSSVVASEQPEANTKLLETFPPRVSNRIIVETMGRHRRATSTNVRASTFINAQKKTGGGDGRCGAVGAHPFL